MSTALPAPALADDSSGRTPARALPAGAEYISRHGLLSAGFVYGAFSAFVLATEFLFHLVRGQLVGHLGAMGAIFSLSAALSHAALIALLPYALLYLPIVLATGRRRPAALAQMACYTCLDVFFFINGHVYGLYKFHIDGTILDMLAGNGASEIFNFGAGLYAKLALAFLGFAALNALLLRIGDAWRARRLRALPKRFSGMVLGLALFCAAYHVYAAATFNPQILRIAEAIPYYYPPTANDLLNRLGVIDTDRLPGATYKNRGRAHVDYPKRPLEAAPPQRPLNVVMIGIDSWNPRAFTADVMPNVHRFMQRGVYFANHLSSSNRTRGSLWGIFFSISAHYWDDFKASGIRPVFFEEFLKQNYEIRFYPSASLLNPPIAQALFADIPGLRTETPGSSVYERDRRLTEDFIGDLEYLKGGQKPFFAFLFYDLGHSPSLPEDKLHRFQPSWSFADYSRLSNSMDPTPYWNLYLNCMAEDDALIGQVLGALERLDLLDNTVVLLFGDHGQEFNENKKNYWGHGSNFSSAQLKVPLVYSAPGVEGGVRRDYRTTHYDIAPTLLAGVLGITSDLADYSQGRLLIDPSDRGWIPVGENLKRGFIAEGDVVLKRGKYGRMEVTDRHLNELDDFVIDAHALGEALQKSNRFYKK